MRSGALALLAVLSLASCAGQQQLRRDVDALRARVDELGRSEAAARQRAASLEDRVLLLQDQVDTFRLAASRAAPAPAAVEPAPAPAPAASATVRLPGAPSALPVVRLAPPRGASPAPAPAAGDDGGDDEGEDAGDDDGESDAPAPSPRGRASVRTPDGMDDVYVALDDEGRVVGAGKGPRDPAPAKASVRPAREPRAPAPDGEDPAPLAAYREAYEAYQQGRTDEALAAFRAFVKRWPKHPYADNAQYWVGECLYDRKDWENARREFMRVVTEHPDGNKVPDAMVKVGLCDQMTQQPDEARRMFDAVMLTFPDSPAAAVAMRLLGEMP